jgi:hypothetical protein
MSERMIYDVEWRGMGSGTSINGGIVWLSRCLQLSKGCDLKEYLILCYRLVPLSQVVKGEVFTDKLGCDY